jgi:L-fuconate dehydratase
MNKDPDYSTAYAEISTDADDGICGAGFVFTIGRGNDVVCEAIESMSHVLIGRNVEELLDNMKIAWYLLVHDSQLRWLGPEKGVEHMAIGAVLSALWDIKAKRAGKPLWRLLSDMEPEELVGTLYFRYMTEHPDATDVFGAHLDAAYPLAAYPLVCLGVRSCSGHGRTPGARRLDRGPIT